MAQWESELRWFSTFLKIIHNLINIFREMQPQVSFFRSDQLMKSLMAEIKILIFEIVV